MLALGESDPRLGVVAGGYTRRPDLSCGSELNRSARIRRIGLVSALGAGSSPDGLVGRPQQCRTDPSTGQNVVFRWCSGKDALVAARGSSAPALAPTTTTTTPYSIHTCKNATPSQLATPAAVRSGQLIIRQAHPPSFRGILLVPRPSSSRSFALPKRETRGNQPEADSFPRFRFPESQQVGNQT